MNIYEAVNIKCADIDVETNERLSHEEVYDRIIDYLGGLEVIAPYIPYSIKEIKAALKTDENLNNLPLSKWDDAAGFHAYGKDVVPTYKNLWELYRAHGINSVSLATGVCILKCAARKLAALPNSKIKKIYANAEDT